LIAGENHCGKSSDLVHELFFFQILGGQWCRKSWEMFLDSISAHTHV